MSKTPKARALGAALRAERETYGLSLRAFAAQLGLAPSSLTRWETGDRSPRREDVIRYITKLGVREQRYNEILALTEDADNPLWAATSLPEQTQQLTALVEFETAASEITHVQPLLIPGLLQTDAYARHVMAGVPQGEFAMRLAVRIGRRNVLTRTDPAPATYTAYIGEAALWHMVGSGEVMAEQMRHLLAMSDLPNVTIRIISRGAGWNPSWEGAFLLIQPSEVSATPIVHVEVRSTVLFFNDDQASEPYRNAIAAINDVSMDAATSRRFIERYGTEWETQ